MLLKNSGGISKNIPYVYYSGRILRNRYLQGSLFKNCLFMIDLVSSTVDQSMIDLLARTYLG